jgi:membrane protease YdiL (CAAX protease family)
VDQLPPGIPEWAAGVMVAWLMLGAVVYFSVIRRIVREGGKVDTLTFKDADLWVCVGFVVYFSLTIANGFGAAERDVTQKEIVHGAVLFLGIVVLLGIFMQIRGINPLRQFGILRRNLFLCLAIGAGLVIAAHPLVLLTEGITSFAMHGKAQSQNVVEFFLNASERSDRKAVFIMLVLAGVVAPVAEETIFRGYLYGVLKRYLGGVGAGLFTAALFAAMHMNVAALPALFLLAICLTLAYEATGSLLVNISMHAFFNLSMLVAILILAPHAPAP